MRAGEWGFSLRAAGGARVAMEGSDMDQLQVAAVQMNAGLDKAANLDRAARLVAEAAATGSRLIVLPELFNLYGDLARAADEAEPINGTTVTAMRKWAEQHQVWLCGSLACRNELATNKASNLAVLVDPHGEVRAQYAKIHLFDIDLPGRVTSRESDHLAPGADVVCQPIQWARVGLAICYDLRFPELFRALVDRRADLILLPSAFTKTTGEDHWEILVRARAIENQAYIVAANQVGAHTPRGASYGHSLIVDPWGKVMAKADGENEAIINATLDQQRLQDVRAQLPSLANRRLK